MFQGTIFTYWYWSSHSDIFDDIILDKELASLIF